MRATTPHGLTVLTGQLCYILLYCTRYRVDLSEAPLKGETWLTVSTSSNQANTRHASFQARAFGDKCERSVLDRVHSLTSIPPTQTALQGSAFNLGHIRRVYSSRLLDRHYSSNHREIRLMFESVLPIKKLPYFCSYSLLLVIVSRILRLV